MIKNTFSTGAVANHGNYNQPDSPDAILKQFKEAEIILSAHSKKVLDNAQEIFRGCFNADYKRGDIVVFPRTEKATYDRLTSILPSQMLAQVRLDLSGGVKASMVINGDRIAKPIRSNMLYPLAFNNKKLNEKHL